MPGSKTGTLTGEDKRTIQTAAHGVVTLMASADPGVISSTRAGIAGGKAMSTATGLIGHVLAEKPSGLKLKGKNVADIADVVFPALTASVRLLDEKEPLEAENFRRIITTIAQSAAGDAANPAQTEMINKVMSAMQG